MRDNGIYLPDCYNLIILAQSVEPLTAEREVAGLIPGAGPIVTQGLTVLRSLPLPLKECFWLNFDIILFDSLLLTSANQHMRTAKGGDVKLQVHSLPWDFTGLTTSERFWNVFLQVFS